MKKNEHILMVYFKSQSEIYYIIENWFIIRYQFMGGCMIHATSSELKQIQLLNKHPIYYVLY